MQQARVHPMPPASLEAEQAVLGAILLKSESIDRVVDVLRPDDFYRGAHREIYRAILDLWGQSRIPDEVTVTQLLKDRGKLEAVGGPVFISSLSEQVGTTANLLYYAKIVYDKAVVRRILAAAQEVAQDCLSPVENLSEFRDAVESKMYEALEVAQGGRACAFRELIPAELEAMENEHYQSTGIQTQFYDLDRIIGGLRPGDLVLIAARPGQGKTALAGNIAYNVAVKGYKVGFFSLEMTASKLARRFFASIGRIDGDKLKNAAMNEEEWRRLAEAAGELVELPIHIDDASNITALDVRARARRLKFKGELDLLIVDYLQLLKPHRGKSREQEVTAMSQAIKSLAKELEVPVLALCQLNREIEKRTMKRPMLSDLRESGSLEQDADVVIFISRTDSLAEIEVAKQRDGRTGRFKLLYAEQFIRFENLAEERE
jgi:replicative DNA helicase